MRKWALVLAASVVVTFANATAAERLTLDATRHHMAYIAISFPFI